MDVHLGQELVDELGSSLETLETQQGALLQLLKDKGIVTDEELAPYLTKAGNASNVRWRAARLRLERLLSAAQEKEEETRKRQKDQDTTAQTQPEKSERQKARRRPAQRLKTTRRNRERRIQKAWSRARPRRRRRSTPVLKRMQSVQKRK